MRRDRAHRQAFGRLAVLGLHDAGNDRAAPELHRKIGHMLAGGHDDGRAGLAWPLGAVD